MLSWFTIVLVLLTLGAMGLCAWWAAFRWWDYLVVVTFTVVLFPLVSVLISDVFGYLPPWLWSEGPAGKGGFVLVSVAAMLLLSTVLAAAIIGGANRIVWGGLRERRGE